MSKKRLSIKFIGGALHGKWKYLPHGMVIYSDGAFAYAVVPEYRVAECELKRGNHYTYYVVQRDGAPDSVDELRDALESVNHP